MSDLMPEVEFAYTFEYRGDWFRMTVFKNGRVQFDNAHEIHMMPEEECYTLGEALWQTLGPQTISTK